MPVPEGSLWTDMWTRPDKCLRCGCRGGRLEINPTTGMLMLWQEIGSCERHTADVLLASKTKSIQKWCRTGLDGGRWMLMEGGSIKVEGENVVARVPVVRT